MCGLSAGAGSIPVWQSSLSFAAEGCRAEAPIAIGRIVPALAGLRLVLHP
jgi:hypothetical protein